MNFKNYEDLRNDIVSKLSLFQEYEFDLIVGLPRSGMIPAYIIGLYLNTNVTDLNSYILNTKLKSGSTRQRKKNFIFPQDAEKILLIDDSIHTGISLKNDLDLIPRELLSKITTCAIYSDKKKRDDVDMFCHHLPQPRVFEWNIFHRGTVNHSCFDIDGVLCGDPTEEQNDDGAKYIDFILNAKPLFIPSYKINALVTSRLEKYREQTEIWLKKYNVEYEHLIMLDLPTKAERQHLNAHGTHKANYYKKSNTELFYESDYNQSLEIARVSRKAVYCVDENIMIYPDSSYPARMACKASLQKNLRTTIARLMPSYVKGFIKKHIYN